MLDATSFPNSNSLPVAPVVSNHDTLQSVAQALVTAERQLVLSTFLVSPTAQHELVTKLLQNFVHGLIASNLLQHSGGF